MPARNLVEPENAFEMYYAMGTSRSLPRLCKEIQKDVAKPKVAPSVETLKNWSGKFNWQDQLLLRDNAVRDGIHDTAVANRIQSKVNELNQLATTYSDIDETIALVMNTLRSEYAGSIIPSTTTDVTNLHNSLARLSAVQVKIIETARKIRGETDKHEIINTIRHEITDDPKIMKSANILAKQLSEHAP